MAMNIGRRPSIEDGTDVTVEVHILHSFAAADFRGKRLRVVVGGFIRRALIRQCLLGGPLGAPYSSNICWGLHQAHPD